MRRPADRFTRTLDCQDCGQVVRVLSSSEADMVAMDPYNYIVYCGPCKQDIERGIQDGTYRYPL
ncbi:hypothetical protein BJD55_gp009 [Gordonia phage Yvonnetastic]|uniref:Uncharacterized protein n=1 Tax=Gordonia phage Yvonnetastic TaxID=1821566 RepID=A0A142K8X5_9CAUD|nr:hypothetical protein BJD55_gp009 [Gordonia phage Yvonnetastic]AMS02558.1 hypothetical protein SEA_YVONNETASTIC_9 [Gordonia phage Yvonnetastic]WKW85989.1 hypothetical protein SEA_JONJAMES_8 [Gordonia Phage JonJames]